jgi:hypothetical protein
MSDSGILRAAREHVFSATFGFVLRINKMSLEEAVRMGAGVHLSGSSKNPEIVETKVAG